MNKQYAPTSINKKEYIREIGEILVRDHGKQDYYKPEDVKKASESSTFSEISYMIADETTYQFAEVALESLAMSFYSSHEDFDTYHLEIGESIDYTGLKSEVLTEISDSSFMDWFSLPDFNIDASWLELGEYISMDVIVGGVITGIGEFVSGIFDAF